jgi:hypothetical protein
MSHLSVDVDKHAVFIEFEDRCQELRHNHCLSCRMVSMNLTVNSKGICTGCNTKDKRFMYLEKKLLPIWYKDNDITKPQFRVPEVLKCLTHAEKMLIQRVSPFVPLHHIKSGTFGLSGHVCAFDQDITSYATILPRRRNDTTVIKVLQEIKTEIGPGKQQRNKAFKVRPTKIEAALWFLKVHNREYEDIKIDMSRLDWIEGKYGLLDDMFYVVKELKTNKDDNVTNADMGPATSQCITPKEHATDIGALGFVDEGGSAEMSEVDTRITEELEEAVMENTETAKKARDWPHINPSPVSEFGPRRIFIQAFPWLFPGGYGDIKDMPKSKNSLNDWGKRLLYYEDGRFASDKLFCFFCMNYIVRNRNSTSGQYFISEFQRNVPNTLDELKTEIKKGNTAFVNHITYYNRRIKGSTP